MSDTVIVERIASVAVVTLNAPMRRNALDTEMRTALRDELRALAVDRDVRAIVLTGAGGAFCAGGDIGDMVSARDHPALAAHRLSILQDVVRSIVRGAQPVVAAVEGVAAGAGLSLAMACDYVVASEQARFVASFVHVGLAADCGLQFTLSNRIGKAAARRMLMLGETLDSGAAAARGMIDILTPPGAARDQAITVANDFAARAPLSVAAIKAAFARDADDLEAALALEMDLFGRLAATQDHEEAKQAFREKRAAVFAGR